jgi:hypothetical protein
MRDPRTAHIKLGQYQNFGLLAAALHFSFAARKEH